MNKNLPKKKIFYEKLNFHKNKKKLKNFSGLVENRGKLRKICEKLEIRIL